MKNRINAFTLIELMITVAVIGILAGVTLSLLNVTKIQQRSRDSKRIGDIKRIQTALELHFNDRRVYPDYSADWVLVSSLPSAPLQNHIDKIPQDPVGDGVSTIDTAMNCRSGALTHGYYYRSSLEGRSYVINAIMETKEYADDSLCSALPNCIIGSPPPVTCASPGDYCYCVQNPL